MSVIQKVELKCPKCGHKAGCQLFDCRTREDFNWCVACGYYENWEFEREMDETGESRTKLDEHGKATMAHTEGDPFGAIAVERPLNPMGYTTWGFAREQAAEELLALASEITSEGYRVR